MSALEPTEAQLSYVKDICDALNIDEPEDFTRECYSDFISEYKDQLYNERARVRNSYNNDFVFWR